MSPDPLDLIWRSSEVESSVFTSEETRVWPTGTLAALSGLGLLREASTATHVTCDACTEGHAEEVMRLSYPDGEPRFFIQCPEHGRIEVDCDQLRQWSVDFSAMARLLGQVLGAKGEPQELVPSRIWKIGRVSLAGRSRVAWMGRGLAWSDVMAFRDVLPRGNSPVLFYLGRAPRDGTLTLKPDAVIDLALLVSLSDGQLVLDRGALEEQLSATQSERAKKTPRKRAPRTTAIDALEKALIEHIRAARDHIFSEERAGRPGFLPPRPKKKELAILCGLSPSRVTHAFHDENAHTLRMLWDLAADRDRVREYRFR